MSAEPQNQPLAPGPVVPPTNEDSDLARKALSGDPRSFELLVQKYYKVLFNGALRMVNDTEDARDITQTTFMKAFEKLSSFDPHYKFFSWIYRIMIHESLNHLGRRRPRVELPPGLVAPGENPEADCAQSELSQAVSAALQRLSLDHRVVVVLRHFLYLSYDEMAEVLDIPAKTVKSRLFAARRQLGVLLVHRSATS
jgi:RNA polymerase sigma-70 factor, ECF subfamily